MLVEEFRLHAELFGSRRFALFPVTTTLLVIVGVWLLELIGTDLNGVIAGVFVLVFVFGLQLGTIGLVGRDAMRNVLGDMTLLVFSARTLPVSRQRLLGTFLIKDLLYYLAFFLTPLVLGFLPLTLRGDLSPTATLLLWIGIAATFAFGMGFSLGLAGIASRSSAAALALVGAVGVGILVFPATLIRATPYAIFANPTLETVAVSSAALAFVLIGGLFIFKPPTGSASPRRIEIDRYRRLARYGGGLSARPILEVSRSSGSVWKVAVSLGIIVGITALLLDRIAASTGMEPSAGIALGTLLGLGTLTTYNWLTQLDDPREFLRYPVTLDAVFRGKLVGFLLLSIPVGIAYLALAAIWYPPLDLAVGLLVYPPVALYVFGVTVYLTGLSPNELLFDTPLFVAYGVALAVLAVPLLVAALAAGAHPAEATLVAIAIAGVSGIVGSVLVRASGTRWHRRLRTDD